MRRFLKVRNPDPSVCPKCGKLNGCAMSELKCATDSCGAPIECWCMKYPVVKVALEQSDNTCFCEQCLKELRQTDLGSEIGS